MNERATDDGDDHLPIKTAPEDSTPRVAVEVIVSQNSPAERPIFPPDAADFERPTTWITAKGDSFVSLEGVR